MGSPRSRAAQELGNFMESVGHTPLAWLSDRAVYSDYAGQGLAIFDRNLASLKAAKAQWQPILDEICG